MSGKNLAGCFERGHFLRRNSEGQRPEVCSPGRNPALTHDHSSDRFFSEGFPKPRDSFLVTVLLGYGQLCIQERTRDRMFPDLYPKTGSLSYVES